MDHTDFKVQTTDNMISLLLAKIEYNTLVVEMFAEKEGKEDTISAINIQINEMKDVIEKLKRWGYCL